MVILRSGILNFEGANGGFFSVTVFSVDCLGFRDDSVDDGAEEAAVRDLVSCLSLVFLSSANWFSR